MSVFWYEYPVFDVQYCTIKKAQYFHQLSQVTIEYSTSLPVCYHAGHCLVQYQFLCMCRFAHQNLMQKDAISCNKDQNHAGTYVVATNWLPHALFDNF